MCFRRIIFYIAAGFVFAGLFGGASLRLKLREPRAIAPSSRAVAEAQALQKENFALRLREANEPRLGNGRKSRGKRQIPRAQPRPVVLYSGRSSSAAF